MRLAEQPSFRRRRRDVAADDHIMSSNHPGHLAPLTDNHLHSLHVTLDLPVDLQHAAADNFQPLPRDLEVVADH